LYICTHTHTHIYICTQYITSSGVVVAVSSNSVCVSLLQICYWINYLKIWDTRTHNSVRTHTTQYCNDVSTFCPSGRHTLLANTQQQIFRSRHLPSRIFVHSCTVHSDVIKSFITPTNAQTICFKILQFALK